MKYLNVAEKNAAAKNIANLLSGDNRRVTRREGFSKYNKIYEFEDQVLGQRSTMVMTSVSGHLLGMDFVSAYKHWQSCSPKELFDARVETNCPEDRQNIKRTLEREILGCQGLIIWTDCDREGENIGFEIIEVCSKVKSGLNLNIYRARFSEITAASVRRALSHLEEPDKKVSDAVDVRQKLDLRIGAAFTRFLTLRLQDKFPTELAKKIVSFGSCQFPTLGFVVERYREVESFVPEQFWKIEVKHTIGELSMDFERELGRFLDELACQALHALCLASSRATVADVSTVPKSKLRPLPLNTVALIKIASRKLQIKAMDTMKLAEKLYMDGCMSYPRTETDKFSEDIDLVRLVDLQTNSRKWGTFAQGILDGGGPNPRNGNKSDMAHPPIYPTRRMTGLKGNEKRLYELIVRSFLACCSKDAEGLETTVSVELAGEKFSASGLEITARNYLEVYPYDEWSSKKIHVYGIGEEFEPTTIDMVADRTCAPNLLTEADLIELMDEHGIGTDATHATHIETIKSRSYVALPDQIHFVPEPLGIGLVDGCDAMQIALAKPVLRANLEADLKAICEGRKEPDSVMADQIAKYKEVYTTMTAEADTLDHKLTERFKERPSGSGPGPTPGASGGSAGPTCQDTSESESEDEVNCDCDLPCKTFTVKKEGPNKGRLFYSCGEPYSECDFFQWVDPDPAFGQPKRRRY